MIGKDHCNDQETDCITKLRRKKEMNGGL
jgi:hypothetical protein